MFTKTCLKSSFESFRKHSARYFLWLTILAGIIIIWPLHNFQHHISQGDHGRDLYCFKLAMEGAVPYRDFSWLFGPLMLYYYSLCYLIGGISIQSVLMGQCLLILLVGVMIYRTGALILPPPAAFICALWYWGFRGIGFFYTYNHVGGLLALITTLYCLFRYIRDHRLFHVYGGFISLFCFMLIRLNMGVTTLIAFVLSLIFTDFIQKSTRTKANRTVYLFGSLTVLILTMVIYGMLVHSLTSYELHQSFPFLKSQRTDFSPSVLEAIKQAINLISRYFTATPAQTILGILILFSAFQSGVLLIRKKIAEPQRSRLIATFFALIILIIMTSHEFIGSGVFYRLLWLYSLFHLLIFLLIFTATRSIKSPLIQGLILITLISPALISIKYKHQAIQSFKTPDHLFQVGPTRVYSRQSPTWMQTVKDATAYIKTHVAQDETLLVLPLDPLYLFLSERDSATRQLVFFEHFNIPEEQELSVIREMESHKGNWVVLSNRSSSQEPGMGTFGVTYGLLLADYIQDHFEPVAQFGRWSDNPGWAWNHSVLIFKRVGPKD